MLKFCSQKHKLMPVSKPEVALNWEMKLFVMMLKTDNSQTVLHFEKQDDQNCSSSQSVTGLPN